METKRELIVKLRKKELLRNQKLERAIENLSVTPFIPTESIQYFFQDKPVLIYQKGDYIRTSGAPHIICIMIQDLKLEEGMDVLILGAKGGYFEALTSMMVGDGFVYILDENPDICEITEENLLERDFERKTSVLVRDPLLGLQMKGPWDRILVTAQIPLIPKELLQQLKDGGYILAPIGGSEFQTYTNIVRHGDKFYKWTLADVLFGPLKSDIAKNLRPDEIRKINLNLVQHFHQHSDERVTEQLEEISLSIEDFRSALFDEIDTIKRSVNTNYQTIEKLIKSVPEETGDQIAQIIVNFISDMILREVKTIRKYSDMSETLKNKIREELQKRTPIYEDFFQQLLNTKCFEFLKCAEFFYTNFDLKSYKNIDDCTPFVVCYFKSVERLVKSTADRLNVSLNVEDTFGMVFKKVDDYVKKNRGGKFKDYWNQKNSLKNWIKRKGYELRKGLDSYIKDRNGKLHEGLTKPTQVQGIRDRTYWHLTGILAYLKAIRII